MFQTSEVALQMSNFLMSPDESIRTNAHNYLLSFQSSPESWMVCRELMVPTTQDLALNLSSHVFYKKLQSEFFALPNPQKLELKDYVLGLVLTPFNSPVFIRKICQSIALIGVFGIGSFWEDFVIDILRLPKLEIMLDIVDCLPFCLEEFVVSKKTVEMVKSKIRENIETILECLYVTLKDKGYIRQVVQIIKNWRLINLPIFSHSGLFQELMRHFCMCDENFPLICEAFNTCVTLSNHAQLFQQSSYRPNLSYYTSQIPVEYLNNLLILIQALCQVPFLSSQNPDSQRWGSELVVSIGNNFIFLLLEPIPLWQVIQLITGHINLSVCMVAIEFYYNLRDILVSIPQLPEFLFENLLLCTKNLALRCKIASHEMFFKVLSQKSEEEEVTFMQFRISAEDAFYSMFLIFNKHHCEKGRGFIKQLGGLLAEQDEFNSEIFVFMMRSILLGITEHSEYQLLLEVMNN